MDVLHLIVNGSQFERYANGECTVVYKSFSPYYIKKLCVNPVYNRDNKLIATCAISDYMLNQFANHYIDLKEALLKGDMLFKDYAEVCFHLGYSSVTMSYKIQRISLGTGREEWGAPFGTEVFVIALGDRIS